jgi:hypothetical protein
MKMKESGREVGGDVSTGRGGRARGRRGSTRTDPVSRAIGDVQYIRDIIDASHDFFVSGWSGVAAGLITTVAVIFTAWIIAHPERWNVPATLWTFWIIIGAVLMASDVFFFAKRSREVGRPVVSPLLLKLGLTEGIMAVQGLILTVVFIKTGSPEYIPGAWLLTFGTTMTALGLFIPGGLWVLGLVTLVASVAAFVVPSGGLWCAGFVGLAICLWGAAYVITRGR